MKQEPANFDFWYAVNNTQIVSMPSSRLETFGATVLNYHLISELMDSVDRVRVREGRIQAYRPQIITPGPMPDDSLEGFGDDAGQYVGWLREHWSDLRFLQYGFKMKKEEFSEQLLTERMEVVTERVSDEVQRREDPLSAVLVGVDQPWEVCLVKLMVEVARLSAPANLKDMESREIEVAFTDAERDPSTLGDLAKTLRRRGVFEKYEERFFSLVRRKGR